MDSARLRVLEVIPSLWQGGLERVATSLTIALADDPAVERIVVATSGGEPFDRELRERGIELATIPRPYPRPGPLAGSALRLARIIRRERPTVIHAHNPSAAAAAALGRSLARARTVPIVSTYHGVLPDRVPRAVRALSLSDVVVGVSPSTTQTLVDAGLARERARTIFNAVEPKHTRSPADVRAEFGADGMPLLVTVGRYVAEKNQALLLEALARLETPPRALVVGYGPREEALRSRAAELGLSGSVTVTGGRDDATDLIAAADVFALSSASEALPIVVIEAMALGVPVVSTAVGGIHDMVADGESGLLVPPGDADALARAIGRVLGDRGLAERLGAAGQSFAAEHCTVEAMAAAYRDVYAESIARRAGARPST